MIKSKDPSTNTLLQIIGEENLNHIEEYISEVLMRKFKTFQSNEEIDAFFGTLLINFYNSINFDEQETINYYTSRAYQSINAILRDKWTYEVNGRLTPEDEAYYKKTADDMEKIISKVETLPDNIVTYRAVGINTFWKYGIHRLEDLQNLVGDYIFERGFTSTSLKRDSSLLDKSDWYGKRNIEIEYLISEECQDGIPLTMSGFSFYTEESEYLINKDSLAKIVDVSISDDKEHAYIKVVYIPIKVWDRIRFENQDISR